jgi:hypothetical protein
MVIIHHLDEFVNHPVVRDIRGYVYDTLNKKIIVQGDAHFKDVLIIAEEDYDKDQESVTLEELKGNIGLCEYRQVTHLRLYTYNNKIYCSTHKKLDAFQSYWGIPTNQDDMKGTAFGDMLLRGTNKTLEELVEEYKLEDGECAHLYIEAPENQFVVNNSVGEITATKVYDGIGLLSLNVHFSDDKCIDKYVIHDDILWVDYETNTRYISPSMNHKLNKLRKMDEPNLLRRMFVLKAHYVDLLDVLPSDQKRYLIDFNRRKHKLIKKLIDSNPPETIVKIAREKHIDLIHAFNYLPGIQQYRLLFERA